MPAFSNDTENKIVEHFLRGSAQTSPTTVYLALFTSDPTDAGSGNECSFADYARQVSTWSAFSSGSTSNAGVITFPAKGDAGTVVVSHVGVYDHPSAGNLIIHGELSPTKSLAQTDVLTFAIGAIVLNLD